MPTFIDCAGLSIARSSDRADYEVDIKPLALELGGGFVALVPRLPGCMSDGETPEEALANAYDAIIAWIATAERLGREIPAPAPAYA